MDASYGGHTEVVRMLIAAGANTNVACKVRTSTDLGFKYVLEMNCIGRSNWLEGILKFCSFLLFRSTSAQRSWKLATRVIQRW
jgi:hypothetical protein